MLAEVRGSWCFWGIVPRGTIPGIEQGRTGADGTGLEVLCFVGDELAGKSGGWRFPQFMRDIPRDIPGFRFRGQAGCGAGTQDRRNDHEGEVLTAAVSQEWLPTHKAISNRKAWQASLQVASCAVVIDAKEGARDFYLKYDFQPLPSQSNRLFLPMRTIETLFSWE